MKNRQHKASEELLKFLIEECGYTEPPKKIDLKKIDKDNIKRVFGKSKQKEK